MEVITDLENYPYIHNGVITVGTFDGVHLAHQAVIQRVITLAQSLKAVSTAVTFEPHPRLLLNKDTEKHISILATIEEKIELISGLGVDRLVIIPFTKEFSEISPESFIVDILYKTIGMRIFIIGYRHGFGKNRDGNVEFLRELEENYDFEVYVQEPIANQYGLISSTRIREFIEQGNIEAARNCLGRHYSLSGMVIPGDGRGKSIGYQTANIQLNNPHKCIPADGVYAVYITLEGTAYSGVMYVGTRPTFHLSEKSLEVHIFDFKNVIYEKTIKVIFIQRIRGDKQFKSIESLQEQINIDIVNAKKILNNSSIQ
jgi:riboflavin kinase/FMN adenylyltransferase